jgi:hypothetical protein
VGSWNEDFIDNTDHLLGTVENILVLSVCKTDDPYLGHFPLSLAVFQGNVKLIETVLKTKKVDFYRLLGNQLLIFHTN